MTIPACDNEVRAKLQEFAGRCHEYADATQFVVQDA